LSRTAAAHTRQQFLAQSGGTLLPGFDRRRGAGGSFGSVKELVTAMETYLAERNLEPKRYVWRKEGETILAQIAKARAAKSATP